MAKWYMNSNFGNRHQLRDVDTPTPQKTNKKRSPFSVLFASGVLTKKRSSISFQLISLYYCWEHVKLLEKLFQGCKSRLRLPNTEYCSSEYSPFFSSFSQYAFQALPTRKFILGRSANLRLSPSAFRVSILIAKIYPRYYYLLRVPNPLPRDPKRLHGNMSRANLKVGRWQTWNLMPLLRGPSQKL